MKASLRFVVCLALLSISAVLVFEPRSLAQEQSASDPVYEIHKVGDYGVTAPKPLYHPDPEYTDRARKKKISGTVLLSLEESVWPQVPGVCGLDFRDATGLGA